MQERSRRSASLLASAIASTLPGGSCFLAASIQDLSPVALPALGLDQHHPGRLHEQNSQVAIATPGYFSKDGTVPGRYLFGNEPQPVAKSRPLVNTSPAPIAATIALEMMGPIPGTLISRPQPASWRAMASISFDKPSTRSSSRRQSPAKSSIMRTMRGDRTSGGVARMRGSSPRKKRNPWRQVAAQQEGADLIDDAGALADQALLQFGAVPADQADPRSSSPQTSSLDVAPPRRSPPHRESHSSCPLE